MEKCILRRAGIPEEFINFFRKYQERLDHNNKLAKELDGRFTTNYRYYMEEGLAKDTGGADLLVAAAILFSHEESYFRYLLNPYQGTSPSPDFYIKGIKKTIHYIVKYMAKYGSEILGPHSPVFTKVRVQLGLKLEDVVTRDQKIKLTKERYYNFFCKLPEIWGYDPEEMEIKKSA